LSVNLPAGISTNIRAMPKTGDQHSIIVMFTPNVRAYCGSIGLTNLYPHHHDDNLDTKDNECFIAS
jgi:hypothetical protein